MLTTANYGFPYPGTEDPPHGPNQVGALAVAVDTMLHTVEAGADSRLDTVEAGYARGIQGGRAITGSNNLGAAIGTSETLITNLTTGAAVAMAANRRYEIRARVKLVASTTTTAIFRIRKTNLAGEQRREYVHTCNVGTGYTLEFSATYETAGAESALWVVSVFTTGGTVQIQGGGTGLANPVGVEVYDVGAAGKVGTLAS
ncbi:hypothetical protein [Actinokineospora spheciospongiae]|uniref:hypothetical protein n=1 Tax=Actinokineospora spheciospongiae TaxID=909613 RepID=UPI000D70BA81|nr:hypothetical protein [Actinokineospora spheciospongiae]PWW50272.1 hypothetical protein DFQ13_12334 [Actinokineospora spheciospongiae]